MFASVTTAVDLGPIGSWTAWKSLKALGNKHTAPNIGTVKVLQEDVLPHIYICGAWNPAMQHNISFTYGCCTP